MLLDISSIRPIPLALLVLASQLVCPRKAKATLLLSLTQPVIALCLVSRQKYGKFTEDCIPDGVFPIGDDVIVFASTYYDSASVHIRRFKKYGKTYYPTPEGITLDPRWIEYIMRKKKVPESLEELPSGLFPPERHIQITSENFIDFTFKRIKYSPDKEPTFKEITISREQWAEMIKNMVLLKMLL
ncbi:hypothetical protein TNCV_3452801 [Trichonephila clavipes]|nr:hypothetical protein TNCV_3452801 [Trichonephila clavipes]